MEDRQSSQLESVGLVVRPKSMEGRLTTGGLRRSSVGVNGDTIR